ncbi:hypothetical protein V2J09_013120 [Rumex salicifolius]
MKQRTWPSRSSGSRFSALPICKSKPSKRPLLTDLTQTTPKFGTPTASTVHSDCRDFSAFPDDVLTKIAATFSHPNLTAASLVCKSWNHALRPLREAMLFLRSGKRIKHGKGGVPADSQKALDFFLKGAARGSTMAMVDAGLVYWEMGKKQDCLDLYRRAAELGDPAGQCNLGIAYLQAEPAMDEEAASWLFKSACSGYVRAQYQLALCLHQGRGMTRNFKEASRWYLKAAESGYARAMYNVSLCFSGGYGFPVDNRLARKWMKKAADHGHSKAQFEHGLSLFVDGEMLKAVVYLELASRSGESAALHVKNIILEQISEASRHRAMILADTWRALPSSR